MKSDGKQDDIQQTATSRIWTWVRTSCPSGGAAWTGGVLQFLLFMSFMFSNVFTSLPFLCQYIFLLFFVSFYSNRALTDVIVNSILKRSLKYKHFNRSYCGSSFKRDTSRKANYHQPSDQKSASYRSVVLVSSVSGGTPLCLKHQRH